ncbi:MAG: transcriptional activator RfaH [Hyphomicrobium sp.]|uniref:transcription termination/antitermination protein NusG n=1 Tax=Hyphomicrobium sp. TaxID=82 RepID=UPI00132AFBD7|nr:transcriptional activator RfaH [Hyphomicrobium sp.]KAB2938998.1 MAG: transcriptional activator RfaH [Hyphomicrobium sp.]MBZ0211775.1 transcriptional activator RfaH [Hyphomicrobium sp.]
MKDWYVVSTQPYQEARAELNLRRQGYEPWLPKLLRERRHARRVDMTKAPLFPGYLFVALDPRVQKWRAINSTFGVRQILCHGDRPRPVEQGFVEALKETSDDAGVVALPNADAFALGQPLRLLAGPFANSIGTLLRLADKDRVALLLDLFGREVQITVSRRNVIAAA